MEIRQAMRQYFESQGITQKEIAEELGVTKQYVNGMLNGRAALGRKIAEKLENRYGLSSGWLLTGKGDMLAGQNMSVTPPRENAGVAVYDIDATCGAALREMNLTDEHVVGYIDLPQVHQGTVIIKANGNSMSPVIHDGNFVAIREVHNFDEVYYGQIYLILTEEYRMLKYIRRYEPDERGHVILRSANPDYDDIVLPRASIRKLFVVGNILSITAQF